MENGEDVEMKVDLQEREFDFLSSLPPEVVLKVTAYLPVRDVLRCLAVCRNWNEILTVGELSPFWRRVYDLVGLPDYYIREYMSSCKHPTDLLQEVRLHKDKVSTLTPEIHKVLGNHPFESTTKCEYAGQGFFVKTVDYTSLANQETVIGELCPEKQTILKRDTLTGSYGQVVWAAVIAGNIVWQTQESHWWRYHIKDRTFHKLVIGRIQRGMGDTIGYCRHCLFLVVTGTENSMHGYNWQFQFLKLDKKDRATDHKFKTPIPPGITQFIPRPVKAHLIPEDEHCSSHQLIVQGGTGACVFKVTHDNVDGMKISPKPIGTLNPFFDSDAAVMVVNTTSEMTLSHDEQLIGMVTSVVYPYASGLCLHIFDVKSYERIISVKVDWKDSFNDAEVLCLSRLYALVGVGHSKGVVKVVHCRTGQVLLTRSGLNRGLPPVIPMARLLFIHYQGTFGDECLVDIRSPFTILVLYRKGIGNIEGVYFHPFPQLQSRENLVELEEESEDDRDD